MEEDKILYKEFLNGNKKSFGKIIEKYKNNLVYFILKFVKNKDVAEDIFQDVILYILEHKEKYNFNYSLKTYMYIIAKSKSLDFIKKQKGIVSFDDNIDFIETEILEEIIINNDIKEQVQKAICKMSEEYQLAIYLTQIEKLSYDEISKIMGKTPSQIKNLVHRAKLKLRKLLLENKIVELTSSKSIRILILFISVSVILSVATIAINNVIKYTNDGIPYIFYYEELPEELEGQHVGIRIPTNSVRKPPYRELKSILYKYRDMNVVDEIVEEAQDLEDEFKLTEKGGMKLFSLVYDIFKEGKISEEEKDKVRDYLFNLNYKYVYSQENDTSIVEYVLYPERENEEIIAIDDEIVKEAVELEKINSERIEIIKNYYGDSEFNELVNNAQKDLDNYNSEEYPEGVIKLIEAILNIIEDDNTTDYEKDILKTSFKDIDYSYINDIELRQRLENL